MRRSTRRIVRFLVRALPLAAAYLGFKHVMSWYSPVNPELAVLLGLEMTRGKKTVLGVTAHPDDLEAVAGGTLRLMALAGSAVHVVVLSDGKQQMNQRRNLAEIRQIEQEHAATVLGYDSVNYLGFRDLSLSRARNLERRLGQVWAKIRPDVVISFDPGFPEPLLVHPDHLTAGRIVLNLSRTGIGKHANVFFYGTRDTNVIVDISAVLHDKVRAVLTHRSQLKMPLIAYNALIRLYARLRGRPVQIPYAEGFRALTLPPLNDKSMIGEWTAEPRRLAKLSQKLLS